MSDDLVKRARELLTGVTDRPWHTDEGGEVTHYGRTVFSWPIYSDQSNPKRINADMEFAAASRDLVPAMADRIEQLEAQIAAMEEGLPAVHMAGYMDGKMAAKAELAEVTEERNDQAERIEELEADLAVKTKALERIQNCDWVITLPDRMDAVRAIARVALAHNLAAAAEPHKLKGQDDE